MHFATVAAVLVSAAAVQAADHAVTVGAGGLLAFNPTSVTAASGDTVTFSFQSKNHTLTQSTFTAPCVKSGTIDSGFQFVNDSTKPLSFQVLVNDTTTPLWFFCAQTLPISHCGQGMVFAVNPTQDKTFDQFQNAAKNASTPSSGGNGTTSGGNSTTSGGNGTTSGGNGTSSGGNSTTGGSGAKPGSAVKVSGSLAGALTIAAMLMAFAL